MEEVKITRYVAHDGSSFINKNDCIEYESNVSTNTSLMKSCRVLKSLENISPRFFEEEQSEFLNKFGCSSLLLPKQVNKKYLWIYIENIAEFNKVIMTLKHDVPNSHLVKCIKPPKDYPDILIIEEIATTNINKFKFSGRYRYFYDEMQEFQDYKNKVHNAFIQLITNK